MSALLNSEFNELEGIMADRDYGLELDIPSFRIKRSHKKSRLGCVNCKRRRVKCDEKQPSCDRCRFRGLTCAYAERPNQPAAQTASDPSSSKSASTSASPSSHTSTDQAWSPSQESWRAVGVSDTELARHFLSHTVDTFAVTSTRPEQTDMWRAIVPAIAYNSIAVRRGMLTLAAMDLRSHSKNDPEMCAKYLEVAEHHGEIFVRESRRQLRDLQPSEVDSNIACTRLLCILSLAFYQVHRRNGVAITDAASWTWLQMLRGVRPVNVSAIRSGQSANFVFAKDLLPEVALFEGEPLPPTGHLTMECKHPLFQLVRDSWAERLAVLQGTISTNQRWAAEDELMDINIAVILLGKITQHLSSGQMHSVFRTVITWPTVVSKGFVDLLTRCSPLVLAVYTHWLMLVVLIEDFWAISDMGRDGIGEICDLLCDEDSDILMLLQWPRHMAQIDMAAVTL